MGIKHKVLILGGGVGGLSTAHELMEDGRREFFDVEIVEASPDFGGKAKSAPVPGIPSAARPYPGEHGFRFFPAFYRHVVDTMQRIPTASGDMVADHLVPTPRRMVARYGKRPIVMPSAIDYRNPLALVKLILQLVGESTNIPAHEQLFFATKLWQIMTTAKTRRIAEYEKQSWWDFVKADAYSQEYQHYLARGLTQTLVAAAPKEVNAKTGGDVLVRILIDTALPAHSSGADRVLDGPTSPVWIEPWRAHLRGRGVLFRTDTRVKSLITSGDRITGVEVEPSNGGAAEILRANYYVSALPVERMATVLDLSSGAVHAAPSLAPIRDVLRCNVRWMTGLQLYTNARSALDDRMGHAIYIDTDWALTSISQAQFWRGPHGDPGQWGNGDIKAVLSCIISNWENEYVGPGGAKGKTARQSSRDEIRATVVEQLVRSLNGDGVRRFDPASIVAWNLDAALTPADPVTGSPAKNSEELFINRPDTWRYRPRASTEIPNLFLASDYVRTNADLATMESANEAARLAVNAVMDAVGVPGSRCRTWELYFPEALGASSPEFLYWQQQDEMRFQANLPWVSPVPMPII